MDNKRENQVINTRTTAPLSSHSSFPDLMTEDQLIEFLQIPYVSKSTDYSNVVKNLIRFRDLPRVKICNKLLYPRQAVLKWVENETIPK
jgi:hypothetical protein